LENILLQHVSENLMIQHTSNTYKYLRTHRQVALYAVHQSQELLPLPYKKYGATEPTEVLQNSFLHPLPPPNLKIIWGGRPTE
jgi:hypothetical protein